MPILEQLISAWNEFATENSYQEIIYENESLESVIQQVFGESLTTRDAVNLVRMYDDGSYMPGHRWWWIQSDGNLGGCFTTRALPIDFTELNKWCIENGMSTPWTEDVELE